MTSPTPELGDEGFASEQSIDEGCEPDSTDDASSNACFEGAEYPISTLPAVIAQTYAERLTAHVVFEAAKLAVAPPLLPSPDEASVEDPVVPGVPLVHIDVPRPRTAPNACMANPEECETAPRFPNVSFEASVTPALHASTDFTRPPIARDVHQRRGPPNPGTAEADGVHQRVERPPELA